LVSHFAFEQLDKNRSQYSNLTFDQFTQKMKSNTRLTREFETYLQANGLAIALRKNTAWVQRNIIAEMAKQLFGEESYYQLILPFDPMVQAALRKQQIAR
jgi:carboxyl-terminal processing protease